MTDLLAGRRWLVLAAVTVAQLMVAVDATILALALPQAAADLDMGQAAMSGTISGYVLAAGALMIMCGRLGQRYGYTRMMNIGLVGFALFSLLGGAAASGWILVLARAGQGVSAAVLTPSAMARLSAAFPGEGRARAYALFGVVMGSGTAIGMLLGGTLAQWSGWRWALYINVVFVLVSLCASSLAGDSQDRRRDQRVGIARGLALATSATGLIGALTLSSAPVLAATLLAVGLVALWVFVRLDTHTPDPLVPRELLHSPERRAAYGGLLLWGVATIGTFVAISDILQKNLNVAPLATGLLFLVYPASVQVGLRPQQKRARQRYPQHHLGPSAGGHWLGCSRCCGWPRVHHLGHGRSSAGASAADGTRHGSDHADRQQRSYQGRRPPQRRCRWDRHYAATTGRKSRRRAAGSRAWPGPRPGPTNRLRLGRRHLRSLPARRHHRHVKRHPFHQRPSSYPYPRYGKAALMILLTGATGRVGTALRLRLAETTGRDIHATTRQPVSTLQGCDPVTWHRVDIAEPEPLERLLGPSTNVFLFPVFENYQPLIHLATQRKVARIVLLSSGAVTDPVSNPIGTAHRAIEEELERSGVTWTFLRPTVFMANDLAWSPAIAAGRPVELVYPSAAMAPVAEYDIADMAAHALTHDHLAYQAVDISGPATLSQIDRLQILSQALKRPILSREVSEPQAAEALAEHIPQPAVDYLLMNLRRAAQHPVAPVNNSTMERVLGRSRYTYAQWAKDHITDFDNQ